MAGQDKAPHILCVNPWIHDFAAYDVWAKPMGLLILAAILRDHGFTVSYIDCQDRFHPRAPRTDPHARYGRGPYLKTPLETPKGLSGIHRRFSRYGIKPEWLKDDLESMERPDLILVTSMMTYWASGVKETIAYLKKAFPGVPVVLGGIYASLCREHAERNSGADRVIAGPAEHRILDLACEMTGYAVAATYDLEGLSDLPYPAYDLQRLISYVPIRTSRGCPFKCSYCASAFLCPSFTQRDPSRVFAEIRFWHDRYGVKSFAFYDDALLVGSKTHAEVLFRKVAESDMDITFHTPNAFHVREITGELAQLMFDCGFKTLRLGVESTDFEDRKHMDVKIRESDYTRAIRALLKAGFRPEQVGAYLLVGLPGQRWQDVKRSVRHVLESGITPVLTHYTPIPHTSLWDKAVAASPYDLEADPLYTNNSIFPCRQEGFSWKQITDLKTIIQDYKKDI